MKPELNFERIYIDYPNFYGKEMIDRHIDRYKWASSYLKPQYIVLDASCGTGYGANILIKKCKQVIGIDIDKSAIDYANRNYSSNNITFKNIDLINEPAEKDYFNSIVCIETIEHFTKEDADKILANFCKQLKPNGKLILTTPNKDVSKADNPFHKYEYDLEEITKLVSKHFYIMGGQLKDKFIYLISKKNGYN